MSDSRGGISMPASRRDLQQILSRWEQLKQQLGTAAQQNEEYCSLTRILHQVMRQKQQAQIQVQADAQSQAQANARARQSASSTPRPAMPGQDGGQGFSSHISGLNGQQLNQIGPVSHVNQAGAQMGGQMNQMSQLSHMGHGNQANPGNQLGQLGASRMLDSQMRDQQQSAPLQFNLDQYPLNHRVDGSNGPLNQLGMGGGAFDGPINEIGQRPDQFAGNGFNGRPGSQVEPPSDNQKQRLDLSSQLNRGSATNLNYSASPKLPGHNSNSPLIAGNQVDFLQHMDSQLENPMAAFGGPSHSIRSGQMPPNQMVSPHQQQQMAAWAQGQENQLPSQVQHPHPHPQGPKIPQPGPPAGHQRPQGIQQQQRSVSQETQATSPKNVRKKSDRANAKRRASQSQAKKSEQPMPQPSPHLPQSGPQMAQGQGVAQNVAHPQSNAQQKNQRLPNQQGNRQFSHAQKRQQMEALSWLNMDAFAGDLGDGYAPADPYEGLEGLKRGVDSTGNSNIVGVTDPLPSSSAPADFDPIAAYTQSLDADAAPFLDLIGDVTNNVMQSTSVPNVPNVPNVPIDLPKSPTIRRRASTKKQGPQTNRNQQQQQQQSQQPQRSDVQPLQGKQVPKSAQPQPQRHKQASQQPVQRRKGSVAQQEQVGSLMQPSPALSQRAIPDQPQQATHPDMSQAPPMPQTVHQSLHAMPSPTNVFKDVQIEQILTLEQQQVLMHQTAAFRSIQAGQAMPPALQQLALGMSLAAPTDNGVGPVAGGGFNREPAQPQRPPSTKPKSKARRKKDKEPIAPIPNSQIPLGQSPPQPRALPQGQGSRNQMLSSAQPGNAAQGQTQQMQSVAHPTTTLPLTQFPPPEQQKPQLIPSKTRAAVSPIEVPQSQASHESQAQKEVKKQHLEQHRMEQELNMKKLKYQQWHAQQQQEQMFRQRYANATHTGDDDNVAFVVPGGTNLTTSGRSRRLTNETGAPVNDQSSITIGGMAASNNSRDENAMVVDEVPSVDMTERLGFDRVVDPDTLLPTAVSFEDYCKREEMVNVPASMPLGISPQDMKAVRHWEIEYEISERKRELTSKAQRSIDEEIELKQLRLHRYLRAVRGELLTFVNYINSSAIDRSNRVHFARLKRLTAHEAATVELYANEQALLRLKSEHRGQHHHVLEMLKHAQEMKQYRHRQQVTQDQMCLNVKSYHAHVEREEKKRYERTSKQRLLALRANDEEAYLKLIDQTKDARITHLLKQTNIFLASLAESVRTQQGESVPLPAANTEENEESEGDGLREKVDYYEVAHRIKEQVTEQPSILIGGKLKEYQLKGLQWMVSLYNNNLNGILADEMGLGKTIQSISLIAYLIEKKKISGHFLVLVPLSTLTNWSLEFDQWAPSIKKVVYKGPPQTRKAHHATIRHGDFQVLLTTYEYVIKDRSILSKIKWAHLIIDEGHRMKNAQSKLSSTLVQYYSAKYRLILTGTPLQNNLPELWALLNFVLPKIFNSVKSFDEWFNKPFAQAGGSDRMELGEEEKLLVIRRLHKVLRPFLLRRLKKDVEKDLPDKIEKVIKCKMSALQYQLYQQLLKHNALFLVPPSANGSGSGSNQGGSGSSGFRNLNNRIIQLRKLCNHPFAFEEVENVINPSSLTNNLLWRVSGKFELLDRVLPKLRATGHRTLIFFQMTQIMDIMEDFLKLRGITYLRLDGSTKAETRSDLLKLFNDPDSPYFCFLLSTRAGGLGLNLQTADTVIIYDTDWNPHQDLQAQDRAHRIGQTKEVRILRLITENSVEENILERAQGKLDIDGKVIQAGKFDNKSTAEEQEAFLRSLLEAEDSKRGAKEDEMEEMDDDELNMMLARDEDEQETFARMDRDRQQVDREALGDVPRLFSEQELPEECTDEYMDRHLTTQAYLEESSWGDPELMANGSGGLNGVMGRHRKSHSMSFDETGLASDGSSISSGRKRPRRESPAPSLSSSAKKTPIPAARGRPPSSTPKIAPPGGFIVRPPTRKGRPPKVKETLSPEERERLTHLTVSCTDALKGLLDPTGTRRRIDLFLELPSNKHYPDYYQIIPIPIAVAQIEKRINQKYYQSAEQFAQDYRTMFSNARWYNAEGSVVYGDANALEDLFEDTYRNIWGESPPPMAGSDSGQSAVKQQPSSQTSNALTSGNGSNNSPSNGGSRGDSLAATPATPMTQSSTPQISQGVATSQPIVSSQSAPLIDDSRDTIISEDLQKDTLSQPLGSPVASHD